MAATVLIADDERNILLTLQTALALEGYTVELAATGQIALDVVGAKPVDLLLMDVKMPDVGGLEALERLHASRPDLPVIMMSGHGTIETAVKATHLGARDFLEKPISRDRLLLAVKNALELKRAVDELETLKAELGRYEMVGQGAAMQRLYGLVQRAAPSEGRVLITGENGTGKELLARALHANSRRHGGPFIKLNCAAVPHELIESELFGHEKGAFTGAVTARKGKFEVADGGTLFLDEVGDMPGPMQAKLLRVLQEGEFERVGSAETLKVDVRVVAATNKDIEAEVAAGRFREDLYFRLNVLPLHSPPLRERREDIAALVAAFLEEACRKNGRKLLKLTPEATAVITQYDYPGNVRELKNLVERLVILASGQVISGAECEALWPKRKASRTETVLGGAPTIAAGPPPLPTPLPFTAGFRADKTFREQVDEAERDIILGALSYTRDNATEAARILDLERGHFYKKMKALGLKRAGGETTTSTGIENA
jgi:two-component system, NtrC family, nitrogen regulation response regulator NtrX